MSFILIGSYSNNYAINTSVQCFDSPREQSQAAENEESTIYWLEVEVEVAGSTVVVGHIIARLARTNRRRRRRTKRRERGGGGGRHHVLAQQQQGEQKRLGGVLAGQHRHGQHEPGRQSHSRTTPPGRPQHLHTTPHNTTYIHDVHTTYIQIMWYNIVWCNTLQQTRAK
jgi:hypothetical protein